MEEFLRITQSPLTAMVVTIALAGVAVSGKFSQILANGLLVSSWLIASAAIMRSGFKDLRANLATALALGALFCLVSFWIRPDEKSDTTEQPFVAADSIYIQSPLQAGKRLIINVVIKNSSSLPVNVTTQRGFLWRMPRHADLNQLEDVGGEVQMAPWGQFTQQVVAKLPFNAEDIQRLHSGQVVFSVFGRISWKDQRGKVSDSSYCAYFNPDAAPFLKYCDIGL